MLKISKENKLYKFYAFLKKDTPECISKTNSDKYIALPSSKLPNI